MKFGKQLEEEINAAGVLGDRVPWIDYGYVSTAVRRKINNDRHPLSPRSRISLSPLRPAPGLMTSPPHANSPIHTRAES
jgi:hypothetical protein